MFIATMTAAGCQWMSAGTTAEEARETIKTLIEKFALTEGWNLPAKALADPLEWFGLWVQEIEPGQTYRDDTRYGRDGQYMPPS